MIENTETGPRINGFYRGVVKAHSDNGRCKIFWPGVTPSEFKNSPEKLPDAEQAAPLFCASHTENGLFFYPAVGTYVWGFFANGDINYPVYFAASLDNEDNRTMYNDAKNGAAIMHFGSLNIAFNLSSSSIEISTNFEDAVEGEIAEDAEFSKNSTISIDKNGITIKSDGVIALDSASIREKATVEKATDAQAMRIVVGGTDADGKRLPGNMYVYGNNVNVETEGGGITLLGEEDGLKIV